VSLALLELGEAGGGGASDDLAIRYNRNPTLGDVAHGRRSPATFPRPVRPTNIMGDVVECARGTAFEGSFAPN
jgi:hypothetical protein